MRTTVVIDDDVMNDVRDIARSEGRSLGAVLSDLARRALAPVRLRQEGDLPVFDVPPDAPTFGAEQVRRALEDE